MTRQYVSVEFNPGDQRSYTYHNDGEPVAIGDRVVVETKRGRRFVKVVGIKPDIPDYATKPIIQEEPPIPPADAPRDRLL